jgi:putative salt-induced outer membrane protein YdiY
MTQFLRNLNRFRNIFLGSILFMVCAQPAAASAQTVVLHLKGGDQISGLIVSENTNQVVISNAWVKALSVPLSEISKCETNKIEEVSPASPVIVKKPTPPPAKPVATAKPSIKAPAKSKGTWHGQINIGTDAIFGTKDQKSYSGQVKLTYIRPYKSKPKKFFRNTFQFGAEYQRTDGEESANRANGSNKSDFDLWKKYYAYALEGAGYDEVRKINLQYQVGPGVGMHLLQRTNFVLDTEAGLDYEAQYRKNTSDLETFYLRLSENLTWNLWKNLKLTEEESFYPDMENLGQYHNDFTSTLSYGFWEHLSLNLTVLDRYNTELAPGVTPNQFEIRSTLGFTF